MNQLEASSGKRLVARAKRYFTKERQDEGIAKDYVGKVEAMLPKILPQFEQLYGLLVKKMDERREDTSKFGDLLKKEYGKYHVSIDQCREEVESALAQLRTAPSRTLTPQRKFVLYHDSIYELTRSLSNIAFSFSSLARWEGCKDEGMERHDDHYLANEKLARTLVKHMNRSVQEHMQGVYALR